MILLQLWIMFIKKNLTSSTEQFDLISLEQWPAVFILLYSFVYFFIYLSIYYVLLLFLVPLQPDEDVMCEGCPGLRCLEDLGVEGKAQDMVHTHTHTERHTCVCVCLCMCRYAGQDSVMSTTLFSDG